MTDDRHQGDHCEEAHPKGRAWLEIDWDRGEQAWKFWVTNWWMEGDHTQRVKLLTKRLSDGTFLGIILMDCKCKDHEKTGLGTKKWPSVGKLEADKEDIFADLEDRFGQKVTLHEQDFTRCDTFEKWDYMMREGTLNKIDTGEVT